MNLFKILFGSRQTPDAKRDPSSPPAVVAPTPSAGSEVAIKNPEKLYAEALDLFKQRRFNEAATLLEEAEVANPTSAPVHFMLGATYSRIGGEYGNDDDAALPWLKKCASAFQAAINLAAKHGGLTEHQLLTARNAVGSCSPFMGESQPEPSVESAPKQPSSSSSVQAAALKHAESGVSNSPDLRGGLRALESQLDQARKIIENATSAFELRAAFNKAADTLAQTSLQGSAKSLRALGQESSDQKLMQVRDQIAEFIARQQSSLNDMCARTSPEPQAPQTIGYTAAAKALAQAFDTGREGSRSTRLSVVESGVRALPIIVELLRDPRETVFYNACWSFFRIALGESTRGPSPVTPLATSHHTYQLVLVGVSILEQRLSDEREENKSTARSYLNMLTEHQSALFPNLAQEVKRRLTTCSESPAPSVPPVRDNTAFVPSQAEETGGSATATTGERPKDASLVHAEYEAVRKSLLDKIHQGSDYYGSLAVEELSKRPCPELVSDLFNVISTTKSGDIRSAACRALRSCDNLAVVEGAKRLLDHGDCWVRADACGLLARSKDPAALPLLLQKLEEVTIHVRAAAAEALGTLGDKAALPALKAIKEDDYAWRSARHSIETLEQS